MGYCFRLLVRLTFFAAALRGDTRLGSPFADHAVLQRDKRIPVWGWAPPGQKITVTFHNQTGTAVTAADGRWMVLLDALPASTTGADLRIVGDTVVDLHDVVVGEVWLCSGQSNMTFRVEIALNGPAEIAAANYPLIRQLAVAQTVAATPADTVKSAWQVCSPSTAARFSAAGYFFARELYNRLQIPIGIINSAWGGTPIESWLSIASLASDPAFHVVAERHEKDLRDAPKNQATYDKIVAQWREADAQAKLQGDATHAAYLAAHPMPGLPANIRPANAPSALYNGMIHPLIPFALRGVLWYQGEANAGRADEYQPLFRTLIKQWRAGFAQGDIPFYWVNLANFKADSGGTSWAYLREAQTRTLALPATGQALAIDIGDPDNIHPKNKQEVGRRLALIAETQVYGLRGEYIGPTFANVQSDGRALRVRFAHADGGLVCRDDAIASLEIAGADRKFFPADGRIDGEMLSISAPEVANPVAVRYAWRNSPVANLYNKTGLPAVPFRSDDW